MSRATVKPLALKAIGAPSTVCPVPVMAPPTCENALLTVTAPAPVNVPPVMARLVAMSAPVAVSVPPFRVRLPARFDVVAASLSVSEAPAAMVRLLLSEVLRPLMISLLPDSMTLTPATLSMDTRALIPGLASPLQLAPSVQRLVPAPPSQQMPVQPPPESVSLNTLLARMKALLRLETGKRVKLPEPVPVPVRVTTSKLWPASTNPLIRLVVSVPPAVTLPDTATTS